MKLRILIFAALFSNAIFSQNFHDTQGKLEISNNGQASFTLPIAMPPSIKDVGPVINLIYVSGQNSGIAGQGWNINTISNITRMSTRKDIDGYRDGVDFDSDDKLSLDGQRLLLKTGTYWSDGSTYETEVQSNTKIELKGTGSTMYFIVTSPDGSRSWYGNYGGMDGTDVTAFYVVRFEDANNNYMTYHYTKPYNKSLCINEIRFSANTITNITPLNKIVFTYKLASRKENAFIKGVKIEKVALLDKIEVFTNSLLFKKYQLTHLTDSYGYDRVKKIQEYNGADEAANPVLFDYGSTQDIVTENENSYTDALDLSKSPDLSGDFDGDGRLDFISGGKVYTKLFQSAGQISSMPTDYLPKKITGTTLLNNKLSQKQSIIKIQESLNQTSFNIYNLDNNNVNWGYTKSIPMDNTGYCIDYCSYNGEMCEVMDDNGNMVLVPCYNNHCPNSQYLKNSNEYLEGDFNGDGISEVLILSFSESKFYQQPITPSKNNESLSEAKTDINNLSETEPIDESGCEWEYNKSENPTEYRIIDLNPNSPNANNTIGNFTLTNSGSLNGDKRYLMDFNSDGKTDVLVLNNKNYKIISFKQLTTAPWVDLEIIGEGILDSYSKTKQILFGDYNGDGKPDIMIPDTEGGANHTLWHIYYSNPNPAGGVYFVKESHNIVEYRPISGSSSDMPIKSSSYYAMDVNKDGKSDLVRVLTSLWQYDSFFDPKDIDSSWSVSSYINNIGFTGGFTHSYTSPSPHANDDNSMPIPLAASYKHKGMDSDLLMVRFHGGDSFDKTVTFIDFKKDISEDNLLQKVTQSNGAIVDEIVYDEMIPSDGTNGLGNQNEFYSSTESLNYPLIELKQIPTNKLVKTLQNTSLGVTKYQDFKYHGLSVDLNGIGVIGFKKIARSSWYKSSLDKKNWNVTENNMLQRGATLKTFSLLLNGSQTFDFGSIYTGLISKTENTFTENTDPISKRYSILLNTQKTTDYLTNIVSLKTYNSYSTDFYLPTSVTANTLLGTTLHGSLTTLTSYDNNSSGLGSNYYIGRPNEVNATKTIYVNTLNGSPDIKTSNEKYFYTNNNLTRTEKKSNGSTETLVETFAYNSNGLLQSKTIDATGTTANNAVSARTTSYTYDTSNRFIKTTTDSEGLVSENLTYHNLYGTVLTEKNPYNQVTTSVYDNWGKRTKITDFLGKSINYTYTRTGNIYNTTQVGDDGSSSMVESDALARQIKKGSKDINGNWVYANTEYDYLGRKLKDSDPYLSNASPSLWTVYEYDEYNRPIKTTASTGKIVTTTYNGLTISAFDTVMTKTKTMNANGQVISATDTPGGTITYKFDANNNLVESDYDGIKITMLYDNWGRKQQLIDTSAGTYTYSYNAFGETKTETTPKGTTTYTLSPVGKLLTKAVIGDGTSITSTYVYDDTNKWLTDIAVVNPNDGNSNYVYTYDVTTKQLNKTVETLYPVGSTTAFATFTKQLTFDVYGRVSNETSTALSHGKTSSKVITHTYKNGIEWQLLDGSAVKWQVNSTNSRGQLTNATLGNGVAITNTYDSFGFVTQNKHMLNSTNLMTLNSVFDPVLANLTSRSNSMFNVNESFVYDSQDRLTSWYGGFDKLFNNSFDTTVENFVAVDNNSTISNYQGTLKVNALNNDAGTKKEIFQNTPIGTKFYVSSFFSKTLGNGAVSVKVVETNPVTLEKFEYELANNLQANLQTEYTTQFYTNISIQYYIDGIDDINMRIASRNSDLNHAAPGPVVTPTALFYVDNFIVEISKTFTQSYDDRGRITGNVTGQYNYTNTSKPYQNTSVITSSQANVYYASRPLQNITYNAFKAPINIEEQGVDKISFGYNVMLQRSVMYYGNTDSDKFKRPFRKYFSADGSMEIKATFAAGNTTTPTGVEIITYIDGDAYSSSVIVKSDGTTQNYFYLHRDYQGSIMAITNATGTVLEKRLYNPWGEIAKIQDSYGNNLTKLTFFDRGYTGHQHIETVGLIHMNGRLYDPKLHRFLQPDNFVQDPHNTQNFNRYGYCLNNPLKYTDQSGEFLESAIIGAVIGLTAYLTMNFISEKPITFKGALIATFVGAISGAVTFGIGEWTECIGTFALKATTQALAHGGFQGLVSGFQGGGFWAGAASGVLSSIASSVYQGVGYENAGWHGLGGCGATNSTGMIVFGTVMGGAGAALTKGNFWQGAVTGLVVSGLNHAMHDGDSSDDNGYDKSGKKINNNGGDTTDYLYEKGKIISSKKVYSFTDDSAEISADYRAYGIKIHTEGTGVNWSFKDLALTVTVAKLAPAFFGSKYIAKPLFSKVGDFINKYTPSLNKGPGYRLGLSNSRGNQVFRFTYGNNKEHFFDIDLGKIPKIKK